MRPNKPTNICTAQPFSTLSRSFYINQNFFQKKGKQNPCSGVFTLARQEKVETERGLFALTENREFEMAPGAASWRPGADALPQSNWS
jgi:hypothetical protein